MAIKFEKIEKVSIIEEIVDQMVQKIMSGQWKPGDKLPSEAELMEALGASKYAVRGALRKLNSLGVVETRQGSGSFVCARDSVDYLKPLEPVIFMDQHRYASVTEFRLGIEPEATRLAALRATEEQIAEMWEVFREMVACKGDVHRYVERDMHLHVLIASASGNPMFEQAMNIIKMLYMTDAELISDHGQLYVHEEILDAIAARDPQRAAEKMRKHILVVVENASVDRYK